MINILIDNLPTSVIIRNRSFRINYDFRASILFSILLEDDEIEDSIKLMHALEIYFGKDIPEDINLAIDSIIWFYSKGQTKCSTAVQSNENNYEKEPVTSTQFSFEYDADYIYAAFFEVYGIDLSIENMHWWKFKTLFNALPESCEFMKIVGYRSVELTSELTDDQKQFYRKMKRIYALPKSKKEEEYLNKLSDALMKDGNLEGLL